MVVVSTGAGAVSVTKSARAPSYALRGSCADGLYGEDTSTFEGMPVIEALVSPTEEISPQRWQRVS